VIETGGKLIDKLIERSVIDKLMQMKVLDTTT